MEINLEKDEKARIIVDGTCEYDVWGERNEEGTMIIRWMKGGNTNGEKR